MLEKVVTAACSGCTDVECGARCRSPRLTIEWPIAAAVKFRSNMTE